MTDPAWMAAARVVRPCLLFTISSAYLFLGFELLRTGLVARFPVFSLFTVLVGFKGLYWTAGMVAGYPYYEPLLLILKAAVIGEAFWLVTGFVNPSERWWLLLTCLIMAGVAVLLSTQIPTPADAVRVFTRTRHLAHIGMAAFALIAVAHFLLRPLGLPTQLRNHALLISVYALTCAVFGFLDYPAASAPTRLARWAYFYGQAIGFLLVNLTLLLLWVWTVRRPALFDAQKALA